jgi:NADH:ubiquinone oxidoreductase subunit E
MDCLGSCDTAPVALFNETLHENLDVAALDRLIEAARRAEPAHAAGHGGHH